MPRISEDKLNERKELILSAALEVFAAKGFSTSTIDDIGRAAGVSKGGIYTHFNSKDEIFLAIAERRLQLRSSLIERLKETDSPRMMIRHYLEWLLDSLPDDYVRKTIRFSMEFWSVTCRTEKGRALSAERYQRFAAPLFTILEKGVEAGEFRKDLDIPSFVQIMLTTLDGIGFGDAIMGVHMNPAVKKCYIDMMMAHIT